MNPYTYQRKSPVSSVGAQVGEPSQKGLAKQFLTALAEANISSAIALVFVLFAAVSVGVVTMVSYAEITTPEIYAQNLQSKKLPLGKVLGEARHCYITNGVEVCRNQSKQKIYYSTPRNEVAYNTQIIKKGLNDYVTVYHSEGMGKGRGVGTNQGGDSISIAQSNNADALATQKKYIVWPTYTDDQSILFSSKDNYSYAYSGGANPITILGSDGYYYTFFLAVANDASKGSVPNGLRPPKISSTLTVRHYMGAVRTKNFTDYYIWNTQKQWQLYNTTTCPQTNTPASCRPLPLKDTAGDFVRSNKALDPDVTQGLIGTISYANGKYNMFYVDDDPTDTRDVSTSKVGFKLYYRWTTDITNMESWSPAVAVTSENLSRGSLVKVSKAQNMARWVVLYQCGNGSWHDLCIQYTSNLKVLASEGSGGLADIVFDSYKASLYALNLDKSGSSAFNQQYFLTDQYGNSVVPDSEVQNKNVAGLITWSIFDSAGCSWELCPVYGGPVWTTAWEASEVKQSIPTVYIDTLSANKVIAGSQPVAGWAIDNAEKIGSAISNVKVYVDGIFAGDAFYGIQRTDVCNVFPGRVSCPKVGYWYTFDSTKVSNGNHLIEVKATNSGVSPQMGLVSVNVTVNNKVSSIPDPVISSFIASPTTVAKGGSGNLSWSVAGASVVSIDQGVGVVTGVSKTVTPSVTTTYTLTATNTAGKSVAKSITLLVSDAKKYICEIPKNIQPSGSITSSTTTLSWDALPGVLYYNVRLDDGTKDRYDDLRFSTCANSPHYYCENGIVSNSIENVPVKPGRKYVYWIDPVYSPGVGYCNGATVFTTSFEPATKGLTIPAIVGPSSVKAGVVTAYSFTASSTFGSLNYSIDWGDGSAPSLGSNFTSGMTGVQYHSWVASGIYTITATVTDAGKNVTKNTMAVKVSALVNPSTAPFQLSQSSFSFSANQGDPTFQQQSLAFTNVTNSTIQYYLSVENQPSWLNASYNTATSSAYPNSQNGLGAGISPAGLSVGVYRTSIKINGDFAGAPIIIPVTLEIKPSAGIVTPTLNINAFTVLPATAGQAYSSRAITFSQTGNTGAIKVTFSGLPRGIGMYPPTDSGRSDVDLTVLYSPQSQPSVVALTGTSAQPGTYSVVLKVDNQNGLVKTQQFNFVVNPAPVSSNIRVGSLINKNGTVYLVGDNKVYGIPSFAVFNSWGWSFSNIVIANPSESLLPQGGIVPSRDPACPNALDQIAGKCGSITQKPTVVLPTSLTFSTTTLSQKVYISGADYSGLPNTLPGAVYMVQVSSDSLSWLGVSDTNQNVGGSIQSMPSNGFFYVSVKTVGLTPGKTYTGSVNITNMHSGIPSFQFSIPVAFTMPNNNSNLTVSVNSAVGSVLTANAGTVGQKVGSFILTSGPAGSVSVSSVTISATRNTIGNNFQNLQLKNGTTQLGATQLNFVANGEYTFSLGSPLIIPANSSVVVDVYLDVLVGAPALGFDGQNLVTLKYATGNQVNNGAVITSTPAVAGQRIYYTKVNANTTPSAAVMSLGPSGNILTGVAQQFNFIATDADKDTLTYDIFWNDGTASSTVTAISGSPIGVLHSWTKAGQYVIRVYVKDGKGGTSTNSFNVTVVNPVVSTTSYNPIGSFDGEWPSMCENLIGWAVDGDDVNSPVTIQLYVDSSVGNGSAYASLQANNMPRPDTNSYIIGLYKSTGNIDHGWKYTIPSALKDGKAHTIYAYALNTIGGGNTVLLGGSPKTIKCGTVTAPTVQVPVISSFTASPSVVTIGQTVVLSWAVTGAITMSIDQGVGMVTGGSKSLSIYSSNTYTLTATNSVGQSVTRSVVITAIPASTPVAAPTASLVGSVGGAVTSGYVMAKAGDIINYTWSSTNADSGSSQYSIIDRNGISTGPFPWVANTINGSTSAQVDPSQTGKTYIISFKVYNSKTGQTVNSNALYVFVN